MNLGSGILHILASVAEDAGTEWEDSALCSCGIGLRHPQRRLQ